MATKTIELLSPVEGLPCVVFVDEIVGWMPFYQNPETETILLTKSHQKNLCSNEHYLEFGKRFLAIKDSE